MIATAVLMNADNHTYRRISAPNALTTTASSVLFDALSPVPTLKTSVPNDDS
jgi:hypothetical protein